ncbi:MAG TPA: SRPBCC domain-containing protein [Propionibacteriaceae bacterium]|jgi:uncharacterized protein YndB with AHSA1/START domain|nr:SRPBCC domain-containing protein [Propionibacteriaceae bacterium]
MTEPRILDIGRQIGAIRREVAEDGDLVRVQMDRRYPSSAADVWDALTDPDRIRRWMMPISGDLRVGGNFQLEGNAGGEILRCERPSLLRVTFGDPSSLVEVRLAEDGPGTVLTLEHTVPKALAGGVAGALYVGPGWDGALLGLGLYLDGVVSEDPVAAASSPETQAFSAESVSAWVGVLEATGADAETIAGARRAAMAQFAPDLVG